MDVSKQLYIRTVYGNPGQFLELVKGVVIQKNLPIKNMHTKFQKPQILVIENSLDQACVKLKFQQLVQNSKVISKQIEENIMRLNPNVVFV